MGGNKGRKKVSTPRITSCFAASVAQSGVKPLILRASNPTTRFSSRSSSFCNLTLRIHQKRSQKSKILLGGRGACPQIPLTGALRALKSHTGTLLFKTLDPPMIILITRAVLCSNSNCSLASFPGFPTSNCCCSKQQQGITGK